MHVNRATMKKEEEKEKVANSTGGSRCSSRAFYMSSAIYSMAMHGIDGHREVQWRFD